MSREADKLMLALPAADVAAWLRAELLDALRVRDSTESPMERMHHEEWAIGIARLIAKLGQDETTKGDNDER